MTPASHIRWCVLAASVGLLTGCRHRPATPPPPPFAPVMVSVPPPSHHDNGEPISEPEPEHPPVVEVAPPPPAKPRRTPHKPSAAKPVQNSSGAQPVPPAPTQVAANAPAENSTIGQLTVGGEDDASARQQTMDSIKTTQQRLDGLSQPTQAAHSAQIAQVQRFLKQANDALKTGDTEGARTLATKARVLLDDIQR